MAELDVLISDLRAKEQMRAATWNAAQNVDTNADDYAQKRSVAQSLGAPMPQSQDDWTSLKMRKAAQDIQRYAEVPVLQDILADADLSKLVANSPVDWEHLSYLSQLGQAVKRGRLQSQINAALKVLELGATPAVVDPASLIRRPVDEDALGGNDWLDAWARRPDSPLTEQAKRLSAERTQQRQEAARYAAEELAQAQIETTRLAVNPDLEAIQQSDNVGDMIGIALANPVDVMVNTMATSIATNPVGFTVAPMAAGVLSPVAAAAVLGAASFEAEYGSTFADQLQKKGIDLTNPDAIRDAFRNGELVKQVGDIAAKRALAVAGMDALSVGLARLPLQPVTYINGLRQARREVGALAAGKAAHPALAAAEDFGSQAVVQAAMGGGGEALGQIAIGEDISASDVFLEAIADLVTAPVDMISARGNYLRAVENRQKAVEATSKAAVVNNAVETMASSPVAQRDQDLSAQALQSQFQDTDIGEVIVNTREAGEAVEALKETSPESRAVIETAQAEGGDIRVPIGELYRVRLANQQAYNDILSATRFSPDGMSLMQAQTYDPNGEIQRAMDNIIQKTQEEVARRRANAQLAADTLAPMAQELRAAGRTEEEITDSLTMQASILMNVSSMVGQNPEEFFRNNALTVSVAETPKPDGFWQEALPDEEREAIPRATTRGAKAARKLRREVWKNATKQERRDTNKKLKETKSRILGSYDAAKRTITLFRSPNLNASTFLHEMGHYWLDTLTRTALVLLDQEAKTKKPLSVGEEHLINLVGGFFKWGGLWDPSEGITGLRSAITLWLNSDVEGQREFQEKFARGMEVYIANGTAPTNALKQIFAKFTEWLKSIYVDVSRIGGVMLSPEVAELYDQLFVSERAVQEARDRMSDSGVYDELIRTGMTDAEFRNFVDMREEARLSSEAMVRESIQNGLKVGREAEEGKVKGFKSEYKAMRGEARKEFHDQPDIRAYDYLTEPKKTTDGKKTYVTKIRTDSLSQLTDGDQKFLKDGKFVEELGKANVDYVTLAEAAAALDYSSPEELINALRRGQAALKGEKAAVEALAQKAFRMKYDEAYTPESVARLAQRVLATEARLSVLATEVAALKGAVGNAVKVKAATMTFARERVARMNYAVRNEKNTRWLYTSAYPYQLAAGRAGNAAMTAFSEGKTSAAADAKQAQLMQETLALAVERGRKDVAAFEKRVKRLVKTKAVDGSYKEQICKFAARLGFRASERRAARPWNEFVEEHPEVRSVWENMSEESQGVLLSGAPWQSLTFGQIAEIDALFTAMRKGGSLEASTKAGQKNREAITIINAGNQSIEKSAKGVGRKRQVAHVTETRLLPRLKSAIKSFFFDHLPVVSFFQILDGNKQGYLTQNVLYKVDECGNREVELKQKFGTKLGEIMSRLMKPGFNTEFRNVEGIGRVNIHNLIAIVLNTGNDGNAERLETGNGISQEAQLRAAEQLTADQLQAINEIWALFEELRKEAGAVYRELTGTEPDWIEPTPFDVMSADGQMVEMTGGYVPIKYDKRLSRQKLGAEYNDLDDLAAQAFKAGDTSQTTSATFTKTRASKAPKGMVVKLDTQGVFDGFEEVIHDIAWRGELSDLKRIFNGVTDAEGNRTEGLLKTIRDYYGYEAVQMINTWMENIASGGRSPRQDGADRLSQAVRQGVSLAGLGLNFTTALIQVTGLLTAASRLGPKYMLLGIGDLISHPDQSWEEVNRRSSFMRRRTVTRTREISDARNIVERGTRASKMKEKVYDIAYAPMMAVQGVIDHAVWLGAFRQAMDQKMSEDQARQFADRVVIDTQGSGLVKDSSNIENGGPIKKLFMVFYSFMGRAVGLNAMALMGESNRAKAWAQFLTVTLALPMIESVLRGALQQGDDDDSEWDRMSDEEKFMYGLKYVVGTSGSFMLGQFFLARELSSMWENFFKGDPIYTWRGPSGLRAISDLGQFASQAQQGEFDAALAKALINLAGDMGMPAAAQLGRTISGWEAWEKDDNWLALIFGYKKE